MTPADAGPAGRRVLVTGVASGIGRAAAAAFAAAGMACVGLDRAEGAEIQTVRADIADEAEIVAGVAEAARRLGGGIDVLVNAAGIHRETPVRSFEAADLDTLVAVNLRGLALVTREALRAMGEGGAIVNVASELAYLGRAGASGYCATKGAVLSLTRSWARELAPAIRVNAVAPGPVDTPLLGFDAMDAAARAMECANPMGRIGQPEEVAAAILWLASPAASFVTGQCWSVDGGAAMH